MENCVALVNELRRLPLETEWVEFKHDNYTPEMIGADISALANGAALAGRAFAYMVWGIDDATHDIVGTTFDKQHLKVGGEEFDNWLRSLLSDNAEIDFHQVVIGGKNVVLLRIGKAVNRPVAFKKTTFIRVGSYTKKLHEIPSKEAVLWDKLRANRFENEAARVDVKGEEVISLLDTQTYFDRLSRLYPTNSTNVIEYLLEENVIFRQDNGLYTITNLGALLFAKNLASFNHLGRKSVRIISYAGDDKLSVNKEEQIESGYAVGFDGLLRLVSAMTPSEEVVSAGLREERNGYPPEAIREAIANALIHQDFTITGTGPMIEIFAHRIEITNPGSLMVDSMRIIDTPPRSRNEAIASLMRRMGICEERGTGWDRIALSCELRELPSAKIRNYEAATRVILYTGKSFAKISEEDREWACYMHACLRYVNNGEYMTNGSLRKRFGLGTKSQPVISKLIRRCVEKGLIRPLDPDTSPRYMKYVPLWA